MLCFHAERGIASVCWVLEELCFMKWHHPLVIPRCCGMKHFVYDTLSVATPICRVWVLILA
eukprot:m.295417 g.295417  ORF g.295417 m.295417 type:complete len:61 (+) comp58167_c0_seq1:41-223(+)